MSLLFRAQRPGLPHLPSLRLLRASPRPLPRAGDFRAWDSDASWAPGPGLGRLPRHTRFQSVTPSWPRTESRRERVASPSSMSGQSPARKRALGPRRSHGLAPFLRAAATPRRAGRSSARAAGGTRPSADLAASPGRPFSCPSPPAQGSPGPDASGRASFPSPGRLPTLRPPCLLLPPPIRLICLVFFPVYPLCISENFRGTAASCHWFSSPVATAASQRRLLSLSRPLVLLLPGLRCSASSSSSCWAGRGSRGGPHPQSLARVLPSRVSAFWVGRGASGQLLSQRRRSL